MDRKKGKGKNISQNPEKAKNLKWTIVKDSVITLWFNFSLYLCIIF